MLSYGFVHKYRYSYGRQANKTIGDIELPDDIPDWVYECNLEDLKNGIKTHNSRLQQQLNQETWKVFLLADYFDMYAGKYHDKDSYEHGDVPYVSASDAQNGIMRHTNLEPNFKKSALTIGKVGATTYYQPFDFCASSDVTVLLPKFNLNEYIGIFISTVINQEKIKWAYGRQIRLGDCEGLVVKLPATSNGEPDWEYMENYIKQLPYADKI